MKRYQVYLNPHSVSILEEFAKHTQISKSKVIRLAIDQLAENLARVFAANRTPLEDKYLLDSLVGSIKMKGKKTNFSQNIDEMYLTD